MNPSLQASLDEIFAPYARSDAPGAIVGVAHRGRTLARTAYGLANVEHGVANSPGTRFPIASVTKHFTCAAVLRLAQAGRIDLDAAVGRWLPELALPQQGVTPRQLMSHTAGLRCYLDVTMPLNGWAVRPAGLPRQVQARQSAFNFEPGHGMSYCNGGYLLLSLIAAGRAGRRRRAAVRPPADRAQHALPVRRHGCGWRARGDRSRLCAARRARGRRRACGRARRGRGIWPIRQRRRRRHAAAGDGRGAPRAARPWRVRRRALACAAAGAGPRARVGPGLGRRPAAQAGARQQRAGRCAAPELAAHAQPALHGLSGSREGPCGAAGRRTRFSTLPARISPTPSAV
ncbi:MAG: beta-lactamase family protein [Rubrivivax sp.]|nr:beta-lactamase family protein [Rubrivivax sp.]